MGLKLQMLVYTDAVTTEILQSAILKSETKRQSIERLMHYVSALSRRSFCHNGLTMNLVKCWTQGINYLSVTIFDPYHAGILALVCLFRVIYSKIESNRFKKTETKASSGISLHIFIIFESAT